MFERVVCSIFCHEKLSIILIILSFIYYIVCKKKYFSWVIQGKRERERVGEIGVFLVGFLSNKTKNCSIFKFFSSSSSIQTEPAKEKKGENINIMKYVWPQQMRVERIIELRSVH